MIDMCKSPAPDAQCDRLLSDCLPVLSIMANEYRLLVGLKMSTPKLSKICEKFLGR
jgi:hypothetical protein